MGFAFSPAPRRSSSGFGSGAARRDFIRNAGRKSEPPPVNQFAIGAEQAFKQADTALTNMSQVSTLLKEAAQQQMKYSRTVSDDMRKLALQEIGYSADALKQAETQMSEADAQYAQYDEEYRARKTEYDSLWKPVEERTAQLAMEAGEFDEGVTGRAAADAAQASARADAQTRHEMAQMGISPESGRYGNWAKDRATQNAGLSATLINQARQLERNRARTSGLSAATSALGLGHNIKQGDLAGMGYQLNRSNTLAGLSEAAQGRAASGRARASSMLGDSTNVRQSGMSGLGAAANIHGNVASTATGLASTYAPLGIEQAKMAATPSMDEAAQQRMNIMDTANARSTKTRKSYPWAYVFGGQA